LRAEREKGVNYGDDQLKVVSVIPIIRTLQTSRAPECYSSHVVTNVEKAH
jgi:hypothetical protein